MPAVYTTLCKIVSQPVSTMSSPVVKRLIELIALDHDERYLLHAVLESLLRRHYVIRCLLHHVLVLGETLDLRK